MKNKKVNQKEELILIQSLYCARSLMDRIGDSLPVLRVSKVNLSPDPGSTPGGRFYYHKIALDKRLSINNLLVNEA